MLAGAVRPIEVGSKINTWQLVSKLGIGGMGKVFEVKNEITGVRRALKILKPDLVPFGPQFVNRFQREANAIRSLNHRGIVEITDTGDVDGIPYYVMPKYEGRDLRDYLESRANPAMTLQEALPILLQVTDALKAAHEAKIVHRDLKPDNIFLCDGEPLQVRVLDFGIAKLLEGSEVQDDLRTRTGAIMGTPHYMAPEQLTGEQVPDEEKKYIDIWAMGAIIFVMLTGKKPFPGDRMKDASATILAATTPPRLDAFMDNVSPALQNIIDRTLEPQRGIRYGSMGELHAALQNLSENGNSLSGSRTAATVSLGGRTLFSDDEVTPTATTITMATRKNRHIGRWILLMMTLAAAGTGLAYYLGEPNVVSFVNDALRESSELLKELGL